jgi:competence protein ComEC
LTLIDVGGKKATRVLAWITELADLGLSRVDRLVLSHLDEDHAGKVRDLISWVEVKEVWVPLAQRSRLEEVGLRRALTEAETPLHFYEDWEQDATGLTLWSEPEGPSPGAANSGMGGVLHPCVGSGWVYSGFGDARAATEKHWAREVRERIHALTDGDRPLIWKATHHGSNAQNALETLRLLRPAQVWVSAGSGNRYGHPGWAFLERVEGYSKERGHPAVQLRRTDEEGSLVP